MTQDINLEYLTLLNLEMKQKEEEKESIIFSFYLFSCLSPNTSVCIHLWWVEKDWSIQHRQRSTLVHINVFTWIIFEEMSSCAYRKRPCLTDAIFQSSCVCMCECVCASGLFDFTVQDKKAVSTCTLCQCVFFSECVSVSSFLLRFLLFGPKFCDWFQAFFSAYFPFPLITSAYNDLFLIVILFYF